MKGTLSGIRRRLGTRPEKKAPISPKAFLAYFEGMRQDLRGARDAALLLLGFAGGFRRSELVGLDAEDVRLTDEGLEVLIRQSKTDQEKAGRKIGVPRGRRQATCPVRAMRRWLEASGITTGPLFRPISKHGRMSTERLTGESVAELVKKAAEAAGADPKAFAGHSLRAGFVTAAAKNGATLPAIMKQTGHTSVETVGGYYRDATLFEDNAAEGLY